MLSSISRGYIDFYEVQLGIKYKESKIRVLTNILKRINQNTLKANN